MNSSLITEAMEQFETNWPRMIYLSFWDRQGFSDNRWTWLRPNQVEKSFEEPVKCTRLEHWTEPKPMVNLVQISLWSADRQIRNQLGFKPVFFEVVAGKGYGHRRNFGDYKVICPTESDAVLLSAWFSK